MMRKFVTMDGEIAAEEEWTLSPKDRCFYCDVPLLLVQNHNCNAIFGGPHEFVTLIGSITA